jgi:uncharacterized membrane protein
MRKSSLFILVMILLSFAAGILLYPRMPARMASHWNAAGEVNGYMPKFPGLFLIPFLSAVLFLLFLAIPKIDPLKENIAKFRNYFDALVALIIIFLSYIYALSLLWNTGAGFDMGRMMIPALGLLFYYCGMLIEKAKRNWFIGIRTPWTLSSEEVWDKTHSIGGKLFKLSGIVALFGIFIRKYGIYLVIIPVSLSALYALVYSYFEYQKHIPPKA